MPTGWDGLALPENVERSPAPEVDCGQGFVGGFSIPNSPGANAKKNGGFIA
jgi:hypothetical protein